MDRVELFAGLNAAARRELAARAVTTRYGAGEVLWTAGSAPRGLLIIVAGRVRVVRAPTGRQHVVHTETAGGTLGEVPLFAGGAYPATAIAAEPTLCVALSMDALHAGMAADPSLALRLLRRMAERIRHLVGRLDSASAYPVPRRLAGLILARQAAADGGDFTLGASQAEVAEELGTVREVIVRALRRMRQAGMIRATGRGRFTVTDPAGLRRLVDGG